MPKVSQLAENKVKNRIYGKGRGWVFTQKDFDDLSGYYSIRKALLSFVEDGFIKRVAHGIYLYPEQHKALGTLPPSLPKVAEAIARRDNVKIQPTGAYAANLLGLSEQVPAKIVFLTNGNSKVIKIQKRELQFRKTTPKRLALSKTLSGLVIEAIIYLGQAGVDKKTVSLLKKKLTKSELLQLQKDMQYSPLWVQKIIRSIC